MKPKSMLPAKHTKTAQWQVFPAALQFCQNASILRACHTTNSFS